MQSVRRNEKWRLDYMTLEQEYRERYNEGLEEGQLQGEIRGKMKGKIELLYFDMQMTIPEIADKLSISEEQVQDIMENLKRTTGM